MRIHRLLEVSMRYPEPVEQFLAHCYERGFEVRITSKGGFIASVVLPKVDLSDAVKLLESLGFSDIDGIEEADSQFTSHLKGFMASNLCAWRKCYIWSDIRAAFGLIVESEAKLNAVLRQASIAPPQAN